MKIKKTFLVAVAIALLMVFLTFLLLLFDSKKDIDADIVFFGDSVVAGMFEEINLPAVLSDISGYSVICGAYGGMTMSLSPGKMAQGDYSDSFSMVRLSEAVKNHDFKIQILAGVTDNDTFLENWNLVSERLNKVNWKNVKYILIEHGVNDYVSGRALDNPDNRYDLETYGGALRYSIENLKQGAPFSQIVIISPLYMSPRGYDGDCTTLNFGGGLLEDYVNKEKEIALEYDIPFIDDYHEVEINSSNYESYLYDGLHTLSEANELIAENIFRHIKELDELTTECN